MSSPDEGGEGFAGEWGKRQMAINGTAGPDDLAGTSGADTINGFGGNDTIDGKGGADTVDAGPGDDTIVWSSPFFISGTYNGGAGYDTLKLLGQGGGTTYYIAVAGATSNIEAVEFASIAGSNLYSLNGFDAGTSGAGSAVLPGPSHVIFGDGTDAYIWQISGGMGAATELVLPDVTATGWTAPEKPYLLGDAVGNTILDGFNYLIRASDATAMAGVLQVVQGGTGNDTLIGSSGSDRLNGGIGVNELHGNGGDDVLVFGSGTTDFPYTGAGSLFDGGEGTDYLSITGPSSFFGEVNSIEAIYLPGKYFDSGSFSYFISGQLILSSTTLTGFAPDLLLDGNGVIIVQIDETTPNVDASGFRFEDGTNVTFRFVGMDDGNDDNFIKGTSTDDFIDGGEGFDQLFGNGGSDVIFGGKGASYIDGGEGDDEVHTYPGLQNDTLIGGVGKDSLFYDDYGVGVTVDLSVTTEQDTGGGGLQTISGFENMFGGSGNDHLTGNGGNNVIRGGGGDDVLDGGAGIDTLDYRETFPANPWTPLTINLLVNGLQAVGLDGADTLNNFENVIGSAFAQNVLFGSNVANRLTGANHRDLLIGRGGDDTLIGAGDDDTLDGGPGNDILNGGGGIDIASYRGASSSVHVSLAIVGQQDTLGAGLDTLSGIEGLVGSRHDDELAGDDGNNALNGGRGADDMSGGLGDDEYFVDDAGDRVREDADGGNDTVRSLVTQVLGTDVENLFLEGNSAIDAYGNAEDNWLRGNAAGNLLDGRGGADFMSGGGGQDTYVVRDAGDVVEEFNLPGIDTVLSLVGFSLGANVERLTLLGGEAIDGFGNSLNNIMIGNRAANLLYGEGGNDLLEGGGGADEIDGGSGNDRIFGGAGGDILRGADGADCFIYQAITDSRGAQHDTIEYFNHLARDKIDLSAIDAIAGGSDDAFTFVDAFSQTAGELLIRALGGGRYRVLGDVDGNGFADLAIDVVPSNQLVWSDFIL